MTDRARCALCADLGTGPARPVARRLEVSRSRGSDPLLCYSLRRFERRLVPPFGAGGYLLLPKALGLWTYRAPVFRALGFLTSWRASGGNPFGRHIGETYFRVFNPGAVFSPSSFRTKATFGDLSPKAKRNNAHTLSFVSGVFSVPWPGKTLPNR